MVAIVRLEGYEKLVYMRHFSGKATGRQTGGFKGHTGAIICDIDSVPPETQLLKETYTQRKSALGLAS